MNDKKKSMTSSRLILTLGPCIGFLSVGPDVYPTDSFRFTLTMDALAFSCSLHTIRKIWDTVSKKMSELYKIRSITTQSHG